MNQEAPKSKPKVKRKKKRKTNINKHLVVMSGGGVILISVLLVAAQFYLSHRESSSRMEQLSQELVDLRSAMNIDVVRQFKIQKILNIIRIHNPDLSSADMYDIASEVYEMSVKYTNLDVDLLCAVITHESALTWDPEVVSIAGAMGLMQIMPVTGFFLSEYERIPWTTPEEIIFDPIYNIRMGARYLSMLINQYGLEGGLAAYNGGEKQAVMWLKNGKDNQYLWSETRDYIPAVQRLYDEYQGQGL
jgi:soluble lytic murein transglycosylase-like protein